MLKELHAGNLGGNAALGGTWLAMQGFVIAVVLTSTMMHVCRERERRDGQK